MKRSLRGTSECWDQSSSPNENNNPDPKRVRAVAPLVPCAPVYDFHELRDADKAFRSVSIQRPNGTISVDFLSRRTNFIVTRAILRHFFGLSLALPRGHLIPAVPSRVQYLVWASSHLKPSEPALIHDIGTGASAIYALLGTSLFPNTAFLCTESDPIALRFAARNIIANCLGSRIALRRSNSVSPELRRGRGGQQPDITVCNPPFYEDLPVARGDALPGNPAQLATPGGELEFLRALARESVKRSRTAWFTSLIGRKCDLAPVLEFLSGDEICAQEVRTATLNAGGRTTRWAVAWSFGPACTEISVRLEGLWRAVLNVKPGRQFANRLGAADLQEVCAAALRTAGWEKSKLRARFMEVRNSSGAMLSIAHTNMVSKGLFELLLKVEERGKIRTGEFEQIARSIGKTVVEIMDAGLEQEDSGTSSDESECFEGEEDIDEETDGEDPNKPILRKTVSFSEGYKEGT